MKATSLPNREQLRSGSALIIVLAFVVLITFLVIALIVRSQGDFSASTNYATAVQADEVAQTGGDFLVSELQQEVREASKRTGANATVWPARTVVNDTSNAGDTSNSDGTKPVSETNPREFLPFRTSNGMSQAARATLFDQAYGAGVSSALTPNVGSQVRTSAGSLRPFDNSRWNAPRLLPYTPVSGFDWVNTPTWIYVTRSGPMSPDAPSPFNATVQEMKDLSLTNAKAVVGRFAYVMYDVGGLLDANVVALAAGSYTGQPKYGEKGTSAFANPQKIFDAAGSGGDAAQLAGWRQPGAADLYEEITGTADKAGLIEKGLLTATPGSNLFFSRQDLIKFSSDNPAVIRGGRSTGATNPDADSGALKFLRTRSRSFNAPMIGAALPFPSTGTADWRVAASPRTISTYRADSGQLETYKIFTGEPVFMRKFPLSRLRWFSRDVKADGEPADSLKPAIKQHFGLTWMDLSSQAGASREWSGVSGFIYTGATGTNPVTTIKTLQQVAAENREPDFFEWLKAAIDPDTLGLDAGMTNSAATLPQDQSVDFQIIQIGANIIDQADPDDIPVRIMSNTAQDRNGAPLVALGVENIPLINEVIVSFARAGGWGTPGASTINGWIQPEIWMPHYNEAGDAVKDRKDYSGGRTVGDFRFRVVDGEGWVDTWAEYQLTTLGIIQALKSVSQEYREIEAREFSGDPATDSFTFSIGDDDFSEPSIPGQSVQPNRYYGGRANFLRRLFAGPAPGTPGFKGVFGGRSLNAGIVPGASGSTNYVDRRLFFDGRYNSKFALPSGAYAVADMDLNRDGTKDAGNPVATLPMGERYYNAAQYCASPLRLPTNHLPSNGSGSPIPLTFVLEAQVGGDWVPVQIMESVCFLPKQQILSARRIPTSVPSIGSVITNGAVLDGNIKASGMIVPGYDTLSLTTTAQANLGQNALVYANNVTGVPELMGWCRPILPGEDPDPANNIYPIGGSAAQKAAVNRFESDTRNPNYYLATNAFISGKPGLGDGVGDTNNDPLFADCFFGWSTGYKGGWAKADPRTRRFGQGGSYGASPGSSIRPTSAIWSGDGSGDKNDYYLNWDTPLISPPGNDWFTAGSIPGGGGLLASWYAKYKTGALPYVPLADLMRNITDTTRVNVYYRDKDNVVRPADSAFAVDTELPTLPLISRAPGDAAFPDAAKSRPVVLNRMFRSPAELGQVFRDVPWRSLDLFSDADPASASGLPVPKSGDTALLDVFCIEDTPTAAGKIDPNKASAAVLQSLIEGTLEYPGKTNFGTAIISDSEINSVVQEFLTQVSYNAADPKSSKAILKDSDVAAVFMGMNTVKPSMGTRKQKSAVEAFLRGLSGVSDTRTWNIFIDLVAEAGRLPSTATSLDQFMPTAQRRVWIFVAMDRLTGRVVDYQTEIVNE